MSTFDFATTIAIGAVIGRVVLVLYAVAPPPSRALRTLARLQAGSRQRSAG